MPRLAYENPETAIQLFCQVDEAEAHCERVPPALRKEIKESPVPTPGPMPCAVDKEQRRAGAPLSRPAGNHLDHAPIVASVTRFVVLNRAPYARSSTTNRTNWTQKEVRARINPGPYRYDEDLLSPLARYLTATTSPRWETYASTA